jgi:CubicO group peptidase (beta-lactamase class C family)
MDPDRIAALAARASEWLDPMRMRSAVLLAARRGKIVYHEAHGPLTWEPDAPSLLKDTIFSVASIAKPVTATAAMVLVEDGKLGLNRPIKEYLPEVCGEATDDIEVQHLLTHTSGFEDQEAETLYVAALKEQLEGSATVDDLYYHERAPYFDALWPLRSTFSPGSKMSYCSHNLNLLGEIIRRVSGQSLNDFAGERLFGPLAMKDTSYGRDRSKQDRWVIRSAESPLIEEEWGASILNVTALDLARFGQMFLDKGRCAAGRILSPASVHEMTRNQIPEVGVSFFGQEDVEASWGLGWAIQGDKRWLWSSGTLTPEGTFNHIGGGGSAIWIDPVNEIVGVYLSVCLDIDFEKMEHHWNLDLFQNMVTAAVAD